jgi:conflict system STAND superfamily ATPase
MLAIVGPSGCGKSSLLHAGIVPQLDSDPEWLTVPKLVPGSDPFPALSRALAATANRLGLDWSVSDVRGRLEAGPDGLGHVADDLLAIGPATYQRRLLVTVDQAEELFTRTTPLARQRFAKLLRDAVAGPVQVVAAMRSEFLDDLRDLPALAGVPIEAYVLAPLDREMLRDVIEQPAKMARLRLENGLAAALVADTDSGEALPLLAFTLRQLADGLPVGGMLTLSRYHDLGGVRGALTRHADTALADAIRASGLTEREVLAALTRLATVDETADAPDGESSSPAFLSRCTSRCRSSLTAGCCLATPMTMARCGSPWPTRHYLPGGAHWTPPPPTSPSSYTPLG